MALETNLIVQLKNKTQFKKMNCYVKLRKIDEPRFVKHFQCPNCLYSNKLKEKLAVHMKLKHSICDPLASANAKEILVQKQFKCIEYTKYFKCKNKKILKVSKCSNSVSLMSGEDKENIKKSSQKCLRSGEDKENGKKSSSKCLGLQKKILSLRLKRLHSSDYPSNVCDFKRAEPLSNFDKKDASCNLASTMTKESNNENFKRQKIVPCNLEPFGKCGHRIFFCYACKQLICGELEFEKHYELVHSVSKRCRFKCSQCPEEFKCKEELFWHSQIIHFKLRTYDCSECSVAFICEMELLQHNRKVHEKPKSFKCSVCDMLFDTEDNLIDHFDIKHFSVNE